jgi:hypothetical protein
VQGPLYSRSSFDDLVGFSLISSYEALDQDLAQALEDFVKILLKSSKRSLHEDVADAMYKSSLK